MEFDKSRVFTSVNADELKTGDKVILADKLSTLKVRVKDGETPMELSSINNESFLYRFVCDEGEYALAYLVERSPEKEWRPYNDCAEMVEDFKKRYGAMTNTTIFEDNPMWHPLIWVKHKTINAKYLITILGGKGGSYVNIDDSMVSMYALLESYLYLDGSPCGIKK